jgi:site-specific DNA-cytosine methylase
MTAARQPPGAAGHSRPLAIDLFCGLGGWTEGLLAEGFECVGFDIERHEYGAHRYPAQLVVQDVLTLHGSQFKDAALIVASPPCQAYSYRAMPWKRAKALPPPDNTLFEACFRIQREAIEAAGHHIPLIVENVRGAQPWVGRARWNFGSFYLWGDVPALMPFTSHLKQVGVNWNRYGQTGGLEKSTPDWTRQATKLPGFRFDGSGRSFQSASVEGIKGVPHRTAGHWTNPAEHEGAKQAQPEDFVSRQRPGMTERSGGNYWFQDGSSSFGSKSSARKQASAMIAKIPLPLSRHIARVYAP